MGRRREMLWKDPKLTIRPDQLDRLSGTEKKLSMGVMRAQRALKSAPGMLMKRDSDWLSNRKSQTVVPTSLHGPNVPDQTAALDWQK